MKTKERILKILEQKNINHHSTEGEVHVFPPISNDLMEFLKIIKDESFDLLGGLGVDDLRSKEEVVSSESGMHLFIRFNQTYNQKEDKTFKQKSKWTNL
jgi:hypothetical protein